MASRNHSEFVHKISDLANEAEQAARQDNDIETLALANVLFLVAVHADAEHGEDVIELNMMMIKFTQKMLDRVRACLK